MKPDAYTRHNNTDRDIIEINKDTLLLKVKDCAEKAQHSGDFKHYLGLTLTLGTVSFLTEKTHSFGVISGETIHSVFIVGTIACAAITIVKRQQWKSAKGYFTPEAIISSLLKQNESQNKKKPTSPKITSPKATNSPTLNSKPPSRKPTKLARASKKPKKPSSHPKTTSASQTTKPKIQP